LTYQSVAIIFLSLFKFSDLHVYMLGDSEGLYKIDDGHYSR